jgi:hypothetical protein
MGLPIEHGNAYAERFVDGAVTRPSRTERALEDNVDFLPHPGTVSGP